MKKLFALFLAGIMVFSFTACSGTKQKEGLTGTWKTDFIEYEGSKFTPEEWSNIEHEDLSDLCIVLKDGGKAYVYDNGSGILLDWTKSDDSITIGERQCSILDNNLYFEYYNSTLYLKKVSNSQEIPKNDDNENTEGVSNSNEGSTNNEAVSSEGNETVTTDDTKWRQFLKDYEAWVDDYIELVKKYKDNPTDLSILSEYSKTVSELATWSEKAKEIELELKDTSATLEFSTELLRIAGKLTKAAN